MSMTIAGLTIDDYEIQGRGTCAAGGLDAAAPSSFATTSSEMSSALWYHNTLAGSSLNTAHTFLA